MHSNSQFLHLFEPLNKWDENRKNRTQGTFAIVRGLSESHLLWRNIVLTTLPPPQGLQEATKNSIHTQQELPQSLFHHAKGYSLTWFGSLSVTERVNQRDLGLHRATKVRHFSLVFPFCFNFAVIVKLLCMHRHRQFPKSSFLSSTK